jgi:hypothetical protein
MLHLYTPIFPTPEALGLKSYLKSGRLPQVV